MVEAQSERFLLKGYC